MVIKQQLDETGTPINPNMFISCDEKEMDKILASSELVPYMAQALLPDAPLNLWIRLYGDMKHLSGLFGAAMARAIELRRQHRDIKAKLYSDCEANDTQKLELLRTYGLSQEDVVWNLSRTLIRGPLSVRLQNGLEWRIDESLDDAALAAVYSRMCGQHYIEKSKLWYAELNKKHLFARIVVTQMGEIVGDAIVFVEDGVGIIEGLWVKPEKRNQNLGKFLLDIARLHFIDHGIESSRAEVWQRLPGALATFEISGYRIESKIAYLMGMDI